MADALVETRGRAGPVRFFCHHCNVEFVANLQEYLCPYCSGGFIEELAGEAGAAAAGSDSMDTDSDNMDDDQESNPLFNDLAFLMSGGRLRDMLGGAETLLQQIVWALAGGSDARGAGAGAPLVLVGAPGDYVLGGEGLDAVVTQLLGQLEGAGPPPLPREHIDSIESVAITPGQVAARLQCSVCWDPFALDERVSRLACSHVFHTACIQPWLQLHATCPICRHSLLPEPAPAERQPAPDRSPRPAQRYSTALLHGSTPSSASTASSTSSSSAAGRASWGPPDHMSVDDASSGQPSRNSSQYNMDLEFD